MSPENEQAIEKFLEDLEDETRGDAIEVERISRARKEKSRAKNSHHWALAASRSQLRFSEPWVQGQLPQMPAWASPEAIMRVYEEAAELTRSTGVPHQVDHIVPLRSKLVSGLHVEFNLRPVPKQENLSKGNRHWPDMP